ncbi:hypothetical protein U2F26_27880 [Micromonospora sp. 4G57]|uniref:Uncharacterized protein n=1 Tax=Micromonospora sicca TaxID=2202420 RepID=A0ABU5JN23_9ACTN|nr:MULTISPECIES: hypothetical protein [unclassified Micromonospora]MDZ5446500.1 hypothetical protein [Micromonospora sp. 4G57]MDZ5494025.1 hypothetical protein [Micromonospora sp. 4G53]
MLLKITTNAEDMSAARRAPAQSHLVHVVSLSALRHRVLSEVLVGFAHRPAAHFADHHSRHLIMRGLRLDAHAHAADAGVGTNCRLVSTSADYVR